MDILLINALLFELPTAQRAGAIVYGGTSDLGLWRPPGPDRALRQAYGDDIDTVMARERRLLAGQGLSTGDAIRVSAGKLRCDFLIWLAIRSAHGEVEPASAPDLATVETASVAALELAARHHVVKVAFGALGDGRDAPPAHERMAAVVRGCDRFRRACLTEGRSTSVEEVVICEPSPAEIAKAKRLVSSLAKRALAPVAATAPATRRKARPGRAGASRKAVAGLDAGELRHAKNTASRYDRTHLYAEGEWFLHPTFGPGKVQAILQSERMLTALFEDGQQRKMIHGR